MANIISICVQIEVATLRKEKLSRRIIPINTHMISGGEEWKMSTVRLDGIANLVYYKRKIMKDEKFEPQPVAGGDA